VGERRLDGVLMARNLLREMKLDERKRLERHIADEYQLTNSEWQPWLNDCPKFLAQYRGLVTPKSDPWPGCSNLRMPLTRIGIETMEAKTTAMLDTPGQLLLRLHATETGDVGRVPDLEKWINWYLMNRVGVRVPLEKGAFGGLCFGLQPAVLLWRKILRNVREQKRVDRADVSDTLDALARYEFAERLKEVGRIDERSARVLYLDEGREREAILTRLSEEEREDPSVDEIEYDIEYDKVVHDAPKLEVPAVGDFLFSADGDTPQSASVHFHRVWESFQSIKAWRDTGFYEIPNELLGKLRKALEVGSTSGSLYDQSVLADLIGAEIGVDVVSSRRRKRFLVLMTYLTWDCNGDGDAEEIIAHSLLSPDGKMKLVRIDRLDTVCPDNERPACFFEFSYHHGVPVAEGIPAKIEAIQNEIDTLHNQRIDRDHVMTNPFFMYDPLSGFNPGNMRPRPGQGIPASGVTFPTWNATTASDYRNEAQLWGLAERLLPISDLQVGADSGGRPTTGNTAMRLAQGAALWQRYVSRYGRFIVSLGEKTWRLMRYNLGPKMEYRVSGANQLTTITQADLNAGYDFWASLYAASQNEEMRRAAAAMRYQLLVSNPNMQVPTAQRALIEDLLDGDRVEDKDRFIGHLNAWANPMRTPKQELAFFVQGEAVPPNAGDDHKAHLAEHAADMNGDVAAEFPYVRKFLQEHMEIHQKMMSVQQRQAMQQAMGAPGGGVSGPGLGAASNQPVNGSMIQEPGVEAAPVG